MSTMCVVFLEKVICSTPNRMLCRLRPQFNVVGRVMNVQFDDDFCDIR